MKQNTQKSGPFSDVGAFKFAGCINPETNDFYYATWLEAIKKYPAKESLRLNHLVDFYKTKVQNGLHSTRAIACLNEFIDKSDPAFLSSEEQRIWYLAQSGNINASIKLVRACSRIIELPFIQAVLIKILSDHKQLFTQKVQLRDSMAKEMPTASEERAKEEADKTASKAKDLELLWKNFLSSRSSLPYSFSQLIRLETIVMKEFDLSSKQAARVKMAQDFRVSYTTLEKILRYGKPGRPKKKTIS